MEGAERVHQVGIARDIRSPRRCPFHCGKNPTSQCRHRKRCVRCVHGTSGGSEEVVVRDLPTVGAEIVWFGTFVVGNGGGDRARRLSSAPVTDR